MADLISISNSLRLLSRGADLLGHWPRDSMALLHWPAAALLLSPGLGLGDGPGVADGLGDGVALLRGDGVIGGLAMRGGDGPLGNSNRSSSNSNRSSGNANGTTKSSSVAVAGLGLSQGEGGNESKENHKLLHYELLLDFPQWLSELKCRIQVSILLLYFAQLTFVRVASWPYAPKLHLV